MEEFMHITLRRGRWTLVDAYELEPIKVLALRHFRFKENLKPLSIYLKYVPILILECDCSM
jgi:hypothetical protein